MISVAPTMGALARRLAKTTPLLLLVTPMAALCCSRNSPGPAPPAAETSTIPVASVPPAPAPGDGSVVPPPTPPPSERASQQQPPSKPGRPFIMRCQLPEPKVSEDACQTDADCDVSAPCHAPACVGRAKANPPDSTTMCTRKLVCNSADANRCGCYQGRCALIPPGH